MKCVTTWTSWPPLDPAFVWCRSLALCWPVVCTSNWKMWINDIRPQRIPICLQRIRWATGSAWSTGTIIVRCIPAGMEFINLPKITDRSFVVWAMEMALMVMDIIGSIITKRRPASMGYIRWMLVYNSYKSKLLLFYRNNNHILNLPKCDMCT